MLTLAKCVSVQTAADCNVGQLLGERESIGLCVGLKGTISVWDSLAVFKRGVSRFQCGFHASQIGKYFNQLSGKEETAGVKSETASDKLLKIKLSSL